MVGLATKGSQSVIGCSRTRMPFYRDEIRQFDIKITIQAKPNRDQTGDDMVTHFCNNASLKTGHLY